jgi:hypothetical protein
MDFFTSLNHRTSKIFSLPAFFLLRVPFDAANNRQDIRIKFGYSLTYISFFSRTPDKDEIVILEPGKDATTYQSRPPRPVIVRDKRGRWESRHKPPITPSQDETFHCSSCNFCTTNQWKFTRHNATQKHLLLTSGGGENTASRVLINDERCSATDKPSNNAGTEAFDSHVASTSVVRPARHPRRKRDAAAAKSARERRENSTRKSALSAHDKVFITFLYLLQSAMWADRRYIRAV